MAIKIECAQCGFRNDLGRVFCNQCGVKLDLKRTAQSDLEDRREIQYGPLIRRVIGILLTVAVIAGLGLAFWPVKVAAVLIDRGGGPMVVEKIRAVKQALMSGRGAKVDFSEGELNGFIGGRAAARKVKALAVDIHPGGMDVSAWFSWCPGVITNLTFLPKNSVAVPVSLEMRVTFDGGQIKMTSGRVGHLPLVGPMMNFPKTFFGVIYSDVVAEKQMLGALQSIAFDQDVAHVVFGK
jgi:hypothetical protein